MKPLVSFSVVHLDKPHMIKRGDHMERKYDATYYLGNTVVHIVSPPPMTDEEKEEVLREYRYHAWEAWNKLSVEERLRINAEYIE